MSRGLDGGRSELMSHRVVNGSAGQVVLYPVLELTLTYVTEGGVKEWLVPSGCFHDLNDAPDEELAGMGLALIGNLVRLLGKDVYDEALGAELRLKRWPTNEGIVCPWPGMPDDRSVPLDLTQFPFDVAMFHTEDGNFKQRPNRLALMARIQMLWVPWLKEQLAKA